MRMLVIVLIFAAFTSGVFCGPTIRVWINGAETEALKLRDRARQIEAGLHLAGKN